MKEWSRGRLRHYHQLGRIQFMTWRLRDSLPKEVAEKLYADVVSGVPHARRSFDAALDACHGSCVLRQPRAAAIVVEEILSPDPTIDVVSFVVMPNHVHLVAAVEREGLSEWIGRIKGRSSRAINKLVGVSGPLWQAEYFDRMVRDEVHLEASCRYVEWNPVRAGLCVDPRDFAHSSANEKVRSRLSDLDRRRRG
jgi:REP element-mobilizing transposase RayT